VNGRILLTYDAKSVVHERIYRRTRVTEELFNGFWSPPVTGGDDGAVLGPGGAFSIVYSVGVRRTSRRGRTSNRRTLYRSAITGRRCVVQTKLSTKKQNVRHTVPLYGKIQNGIWTASEHGIE